MRDIALMVVDIEKWMDLNVNFGLNSIYNRLDVKVEGKGGIEDDFQDSIFIICVDGGINSSFGEDWGRSGFEEHIKTSFVHKFDTHRKYPNIHVSRQVSIGAQGTEKCESRNLAVMREI